MAFNLAFNILVFSFAKFVLFSSPLKTINEIIIITEQKGKNELSTSIRHSLLPDSGFTSRLTLLPPGLPHQIAGPTKP